MSNKFEDKDVEKLYLDLKKGKHDRYNEKQHCMLMLNIMMNPRKGTISSFCTAAVIAEGTFWKWLEKYPMLKKTYQFGKMVAREIWEEEGRILRDSDYPMGTVNYSFEYWKLIGWSRYGVSKNPRVKVNIKDGETPAQHYSAILKQASEGDFTASEFKQMMEAVNVGLNVHQVFELQKQIDELKSALVTMEQNTNVKNPFADQGTS